MKKLSSVCFVGSGAIDRHATIKRAFGMAPWLRRAGVEATVICEDAPANRLIAERLGVHLQTYAAGSLLSERNAKNKLLSKQRCDIVHICGLGWRNYVLVRHNQHTKYVMDHVELESSLSGVSALRRCLQRYLERASLARYDGTVVASKYLESLFKCNSRGRILYLPFGADPFADNELKAAEEWSRVKLESPYILFAGGIYRNYGIWTMIEAMQLAVRHDPSITLVIAGRGPDRASAEQVIQSRGLSKNIRILGYVSTEELNNRIINAVGLVAPLNDTIADRARCPSKIPMYMMSGRPVVTCKIGEAWEYLGESGRYYIPEDASSLCQQLLDVWQNRGLARTPVKASVTWENLTHKYITFWSS